MRLNFLSFFPVKPKFTVDCSCFYGCRLWQRNLSGVPIAMSAMRNPSLKCGVYFGTVLGKYCHPLIPKSSLWNRKQCYILKPIEIQSPWKKISRTEVNALWKLKQFNIFPRKYDAENLPGNYGDCYGYQQINKGLYSTFILLSLKKRVV